MEGQPNSNKAPTDGEGLQELVGLVKAADAAAENLDVPELQAMETAAELYQQALQGFSQRGLERPKLQAKLDAANDRIADLLLSAPAPAPAERPARSQRAGAADPEWVHRLAGLHGGGQGDSDHL